MIMIVVVKTMKVIMIISLMIITKVLNKNHEE